MKSLLQRLKRIDYLISHKKTGNPETLATKVGLSERSVYDYIRLMKQMGAEIKYSRLLESYYYTESGQFRIGFLPKSDNDFAIAINSDDRPQAQMERGVSVRLN